MGSNLDLIKYPVVAKRAKQNNEIKSVDGIKISLLLGEITPIAKMIRGTKTPCRLYKLKLQPPKVTDAAALNFQAQR